MLCNPKQGKTPPSIHSALTHMDARVSAPSTPPPPSAFELQKRAEATFRGLVNPPPIAVRSHSRYPTHILCYYKETVEVHQSMDAFGPEFDPTIVVVCENVKGPGPLSVLSQYFQGPTPVVGLNVGTHRTSGAPFLLYVKSEQEPRGKRFSHRLGADLIRAMHSGNIEKVHVLFQDADTASNPITLMKMMEEACLKNADMVGPSMTSFNSVPWTITGSYTSYCEVLAVSERVLEVAFIGKARILGGACVMLRLTTYYQFADLLCRPAADMSLLERISYATEDTLISHILSLSGYRSQVVLDEAAWNLPQTYSELLKQRRRWMNGEIATFLISARFVKPTFTSFVFYLWTVLYFLKTWIINNSFSSIMLYTYLKHGYTLLAAPAIFMLLLKAYTTMRYFRRSPDGEEAQLSVLAHLYCMCNAASIGAGLYYFRHDPWVSGILLGVPLIQLAILMKGSVPRKLYLSISGIVYLFYSRALQQFCQDYALANISDVSWGVRETKRDQAVYGNQSNDQASRSTRSSDLLTHAWIMLLLQVLIPLSMVWLMLATPSGVSTYLAIAGVDACVYYLLLVVRALKKHTLLEPFLAEPAFNLKSRLVYPKEQNPEESSGPMQEALPQAKSSDRDALFEPLQKVIAQELSHTPHSWGTSARDPHTRFLDGLESEGGPVRLRAAHHLNATGLEQQDSPMSLTGRTHSGHQIRPQRHVLAQDTPEAEER